MKLFLFKCLIVMRLLIRIFKTLLKAITFFYRHMDNYPILIKISSFIFQRANQNKTWFYYKPSKWSETLDMQLIRKGTLFFFNTTSIRGISIRLILNSFAKHFPLLHLLHSIDFFSIPYISGEFTFLINYRPHPLT